MLYSKTTALRLLCGFLVFGVLLSACELVHNEPSYGDVSVETGRVELSIINRTDKPVYVFIVGRELSALIDWIPTVEGEGIAPSGLERRRYADMDFLQNEREAVVYWWHATVKNGVRTFDELHSFVVPLPSF